MNTPYISLKNRSSKKLSEEELVSGLKIKDVPTFTYLVKNYSYALKKTIDKCDTGGFSDDFLQDTFIKIWENIHSFDASKGRLFSWMATIARNVALTTMGSKSYKKAHLTTAIEEYIDIHPYLLDQDNYLNTNSDMLNLLELVQKYAPTHTDLITSYVHGRPYREIGKQYGLGISVVSYRIHKSLESIKEALNTDLFHLGKPLKIVKPRKTKSENVVIRPKELKPAKPNLAKLDLGSRVRELKAKTHKMKYIAKTLGVCIATCHNALRYLRESENADAGLLTFEQERMRLGKKVFRLRLKKLSMKAISKQLKISVSTCYSALRYLEEINESKRDFGAYLKNMRQIARHVREAQQQGKSPKVVAKTIGVHIERCYSALRMFR